MPDLFLIFGLPGTGKTTLANALARTIGARRQNSDGMRKELGLRGHYDPASKQDVYKHLLDQALDWIRDGSDVVIDATFIREEERRHWEQSFDALDTTIYWIEIRVGEQTALERVSHKRPDSEADVKVYRKLSREWEAMHENHMILWSDRQAIPEMIRQVMGWRSTVHAMRAP